MHGLLPFLKLESTKSRPKFARTCFQGQLCIEQKDSSLLSRSKLERYQLLPVKVKVWCAFQHILRMSHYMWRLLENCLSLYTHTHSLFLSYCVCLASFLLFLHTDTDFSQSVHAPNTLFPSKSPANLASSAASVSLILTDTQFSWCFWLFMCPCPLWRSLQQSATSSDRPSVPLSLAFAL